MLTAMRQKLSVLFFVLLLLFVFLLKYSIGESIVDRKWVMMRYDQLNDIVLDGKKVAVFAEYDDRYKQKYNPELFFVDSAWVAKPYNRLLKKKIRDFKEHFDFEDLLAITPFIVIAVPTIAYFFHCLFIQPDKYLTVGLIVVAALMVVLSLIALCCIGDGILAKVFAEWLFRGTRFKMNNNTLLRRADHYDAVQRFAIPSENYRPVEKIEEEVVEKSNKSGFREALKSIWANRKRQDYLTQLVNASNAEEQLRNKKDEIRAHHYVRFLASLDADELQFFVNASLRLKALPAEIDELKKLAEKNAHWKRNVFLKDLADRIMQREDEQRFCQKVMSDFGERFEKSWHDEQVGEVDAKTLKVLAA